MSTGCKSSHNGFLDVSRSNGGLRLGPLMPIGIGVGSFVFKRLYSVMDERTGREHYAYNCQSGLVAPENKDCGIICRTIGKLCSVLQNYELLSARVIYNVNFTLYNHRAGFC